MQQGSDRGGFSFCGVDIATLGLHYAPPLNETYVYESAQSKVHDEVFDSHNGGYFYGTSLQPKTFTLRCYFENNDINEGALTRIGSFFKKGKTGRLVFDKRNWVWYNATVVNIDFSQLTNYMNGFVNISMKAYYPYGRTSEDGLPAETDDNYQSIINNSGLIDRTKLPSKSIVADGSSLTRSTEFRLYNGGTEAAGVAISIAGDVGEGVTITNRTTGQSCSFTGISKTVTTNANKYIVCDGINGKTIITNGQTGELAFLYHDSGFIDLAPSYPITRELTVSTTANSKTITSTIDCFDADMVGKFILIGSTWYKIAAVTNSKQVTLETNVSTKATVSHCVVVTMNELVVEPKSTMDLTKLQFDYYPTFT